MKTKLLLLTLLMSAFSWGQLSLTDGAPTATIDFSNSMQTSVGSNPSTAFVRNFSPNPTVAGRLNSNAWEIAGFSDGGGLLAFGDTQTSNNDYGRGNIATFVTTGGIYSYTGAPHSVANPCLMIQPSGADFTPGTLTLRIQNNGVNLMTQLAVSYNLFVRNDQARSNSFNFSYSSDNTTYTTVPALDYTSTAALDALGWVQVGTSPSRTTTITGLTVAPGDYFYIRWSSADVGGSGSVDEFGLDDISCTATYGVCSTPVNQSSGISVSAYTTTSMTLTWTNPALAYGSMVVIRQNLSPNVVPTSGTTYTASTIFGTPAANIGSNNYVVYKGTGTSVVVTGLTAGNPYTISVYGYNPVNCYNTTAPESTLNYTLSNEPTSHAAGFTGCTGTSISTIDLTFPAASSLVNANGYIILGRANALPTGVPVDGNLYTSGTILGDSFVVGNVNNSATAITATGLDGGTTYFFKLIPFGSFPGVGQTYNYRTAATVPSTSCLTSPAPEINVRGVVGLNPTISDGDMTTSALDNTLFATTQIGFNQTKTFRIENVGNLNLTVSSITLTGANPGDFSITASAPYTILGSTFVDFTITFAPVAFGTRTAIVNIANNDFSEGLYDFMIEGTGDCAVIVSTISPASGPAGTEVIINATSGDISGATVSFNGIPAASVTQLSATQVVAVVPNGASSGNIITTNSLGCFVYNPFTVIDFVGSGCEGSNTVSELFISEVTDATFGGLTYVEIFNGTGAPVNLANYSLQFLANGNATAYSTVALTGTILNNSTYVVSTDRTTSYCTGAGGEGLLANQSSGISGINFVITENDHIALYHNVTKVDVWGTYLSNNWGDGLGIGDRGVDFRRLNTATIPSTTFNLSDWNIIDWPGTGIGSCAQNDYSDIGLFEFIFGLPPTIVQEPVVVQNCAKVTITIEGDEGFVGSNPLAYQWFSVAPGASNWIALTDAGVYSGTNTPELTILNSAGLGGYQYYCQVRENTITCYQATEAVKISEPNSTSWNGAWTNGAPDLTKAVVIETNYDTLTYGSFSACSVTVNNGINLLINTNVSNINNTVTIRYDLVTLGTGTVTVNDDCSLVMIEDDGVVTNNGTMSMSRQTSPFKKFDYVYWSSPLTNANLATTFAGWRLDYAFQFVTPNFEDLLTINNLGVVTNTIPDTFDDYAPWAWQPYTGVMTPGKGYAIMAPTSGTFPRMETRTFTGVGNLNKFNNGIITVPLALSSNATVTTDDYNLVGNPYPSAIFANDFINANLPNISGTIYFWTHNSAISGGNPGNSGLNHTTNDYAMYNLTGSVATSTACLTCGAAPTGYIPSGQGFLVEAENDVTSVVFNNSMRSNTYINSDFYRSSTPSTTGPTVGETYNRIWLNFSNSVGMFSQQLIGYFNSATNGYDKGYDGRHHNALNYVNFYSLIGTDMYRIQGRTAFVETDEVPLGYTTAVAGTFTISSPQQEGVLAEIPVYLEDKATGIFHNLKMSPYTFDTAVGTFDDRFVLRYTNTTLGAPDFEGISSQVVAFGSDGIISIRSAVESIASVTVFDILGRTLLTKNGLSANTVSFVNPSKSTEALLLKITLQNGQVVTRKIVF